MQPTEVLKSEHRVIEQVLNCLEKIASRCASEGKLDRTAAQKAIDFFQNFADHCHHGKEEEHLFPLLEARGFSRGAGPTGVMLYEHEQGRRLLRSLAAAVEDDARGLPNARQRFVDQARSYVQLLREHIVKEDQCLFPKANQVLTPEDQEALQDAFEKVESEEMGLGTHEEYLHLANELADRLDVPRVSGEPTAGRGCCGHHARR
jgi:hemerythrin-like domain-containing protein